MPIPDQSDRTDLAEDRTILASERTFASWLRTSLAAVGVGIAFHVLFGRVEPNWVPRLIATAFLSVAILVIWRAERRATAMKRRLEPHVVSAARAVNVRLIAGVVIVAALALIAAVWFLTFP